MYLVVEVTKNCSLKYLRSRFPSGTEFHKFEDFTRLRFHCDEFWSYHQYMTDCDCRRIPESVLFCVDNSPQFIPYDIVIHNRYLRKFVLCNDDEYCGSFGWCSL